MLHNKKAYTDLSWKYLLFEGLCREKSENMKSPGKKKTNLAYMIHLILKKNMQAVTASHT